MTVTFYKYGKDGKVHTKTSGAEFSVKVYPLICDKLTLTCELPSHLHQHIIKNFKQEKAKHYGGYKYSSWIDGLTMTPPPYSKNDEEKHTGAFIQCKPYSSDVGFLRIDFNPATVDITHLKNAVTINYLNHPELDFNYILEHGKVTRFDAAVDIAHEQVGDMFYYYPKIQYTEVHTKSGRTEYLGGKIKPSKWIVIYDRLPAIKANNYKKYYDPLKQLAVPTHDVMRVEIRLFPKIPFSSLAGLKNPFAPLIVSAPSTGYKDDPLWDLFLALARFEGAQAALGRLSKSRKEKFVKRLKAAQTKWWDPDKIWGQFDYVFESIKST